MRSRFFICQEFWSGQTLIVAIDAIESIYEKGFEYFSKEEIPEDFDFIQPATVINLKTNGKYYIRNSLEEVVEFLKGENNG